MSQATFRVATVSLKHVRALAGAVTQKVAGPASFPLPLLV